MGDVTTWVGLDVHQEEIVVAVLEGSSREATEFRVGGDGRGIGKLVRGLKKFGSRVECAYEAGPCGYTLERRLESEGLGCVVVAPSLTPVQPGQRIKTDRRDARKLAEHLRAGLLTADPTNHGPAALRRTLDVTREYQLDSSSKRPDAPRLLNVLNRNHPPWTPP